LYQIVSKIIQRFYFQLWSFEYHVNICFVKMVYLEGNSPGRFVTIILKNDQYL
jgi:hypothetical protein